MNKGFIYFLFLVLLATFANSTCKVSLNDKELITLDPVMIGSVPNGQKLLIGSLADPEGNYLYVAKLKGSSSEMGEAFGKLFAQEIK